MPRTVYRQLAERLLAILLPAPCLACGREESGALGLCLACRGRLRRLPRGRCPTCARPLADPAPPAGYRCIDCRRRPPAFAALVGRFRYEPPLAEVVRALKFSRLPYLGRHLGLELAAAVAASGELEHGLDVVCPVPLHWRRRLARGYNQAEEIARPLAAELGLPLARLLARRRATAAQARLPWSARGAGLGRAFRARPGAAGARVLLVDDVFTTGATLRAAAACLAGAGARRVVAAAAALTAPPGRQ